MPSLSAALSVIPERLLEAFGKGDGALFLGADLPRAITGLPSRADLARDLARRHGLDELLPLAEVAQRVSQAGNRFEFTDFIRNALDTASLSPQPFHQRLVAAVRQYRIETIMTTAYDDLLEQAFQQAKMPINRVVRGSDVSFLRPDRPALIKLYGAAQQPDTLIVTDRDHSALLRDRDREPLIDEVRQAFRRKTLLFLGYNLADTDFRFLFDQIADSRFARLAYAVWPGLPEADVRMWRDRGIVILEADPLGAVNLQPQPAHCPEPQVNVPAGEPELAWNAEVIRRLLADALSSDDLSVLCYDHFHEVYELFGKGTSKDQKIEQLLDYCTRRDRLGELVGHVEQEYAIQYARYAARLRL